MAVLSDNSYAQFYGKFRSSAPKVKVRDDNITCLAKVHMILLQALMKEIELRADNATE